MENQAPVPAVSMECKGIRVYTQSHVSNSILQCCRNDGDHKKTYTTPAIAKIIQLRSLIHSGKFSDTKTEIDQFKDANDRAKAEESDDWSPSWPKYRYFRDLEMKALTVDNEDHPSELFHDGALYIDYHNLQPKLVEYAIADPNCIHGQWGLEDSRRHVTVGVPEMGLPPLYTCLGYCKYFHLVKSTPPGTPRSNTPQMRRPPMPPSGSNTPRGSNRPPLSGSSSRSNTPQYPSQPTGQRRRNILPTVGSRHGGVRGPPSIPHLSSANTPRSNTSSSSSPCPSPIQVVSARKEQLKNREEQRSKRSDNRRSTELSLLNRELEAMEKADEEQKKADDARIKEQEKADDARIKEQEKADEAAARRAQARIQAIRDTRARIQSIYADEEQAGNEDNNEHKDLYHDEMDLALRYEDGGMEMAHERSLGDLQGTNLFDGPGSPNPSPESDEEGPEEDRKPAFRPTPAQDAPQSLDDSAGEWNSPSAETSQKDESGVDPDAGGGEWSSPPADEETVEQEDDQSGQQQSFPAPNWGPNMNQFMPGYNDKHWFCLACRTRNDREVTRCRACLTIQGATGSTGPTAAPKQENASTTTEPTAAPKQENDSTIGGFAFLPSEGNANDASTAGGFTFVPSEGNATDASTAGGFAFVPSQGNATDASTAGGFAFVPSQGNATDASTAGGFASSSIQGASLLSSNNLSSDSAHSKRLQPQSHDEQRLRKKPRTGGTKQLGPKQKPTNKQTSKINAPKPPPNQVAVVSQSQTRRTIVLFGENDNNALCIPSLTGVVFDYHPPHEIEDLDALGAPVEAVALSSLSTMCLTEQKQVFTAGAVDKGILGRIMTGMFPNDDEDGEDREGATLLPIHFYTKDGFCEDGQIIQIGGGENYAAALSLSGNLYIWGCQIDCRSDHKKVFRYDRTGNNFPQGFDPTPTHVHVGRKVISIHCGMNFCIVVVDDGTICSFGFGNNGELCRQGTMCVAVPELAQGNIIPMDFRYFDMETGALNVTALEEFFLTPKPVEIPREFRRATVQKLVCGSCHWLVLVNVRGVPKVYSVGLGKALGLGNLRDLEGDQFERLSTDEKLRNDGSRNSLHLIDYFEAENIRIVDIAAGAYHNLALSSTGHLFAWGDGGHGQLGIPQAELNNEGCILSPRRVNTFPAGTTIRKIACGERFSMALSDEGTLYTFGSSGAGHLSDPIFLPTPLDLHAALPNSRIAKILDMQGGSSHGCVLVEVIDFPEDEDDHT